MSPETQTVLLAIGLVGLAEGLVVSPLIGGIFNQVAPDDAGAASGAASTVTQFALAVVTALLCLRRTRTTAA